MWRLTPLPGGDGQYVQVIFEIGTDKYSSISISQGVNIYK